jgi:mono/diheme cytochrome c family protein
MRLVNMILSCAAALLFPVGVMCQGTPKIKEVPIKSTPVADGAAMYAEYCAVCHGATGKGDGPAAPALKTAPGNLTMLSQRNNGKFPEMQVQSMIEGKIGVTAHGTREMPVWGPLFKYLGTSGNGTSSALLRVKNLTDYVKTLQTK